jgi:hypothetical protein
MTKRNFLARLAYLTHPYLELTKPVAKYGDPLYNNSTGTMAQLLILLSYMTLSCCEGSKCLCLSVFPYQREDSEYYDAFNDVARARVVANVWESQRKAFLLD